MFYWTEANVFYIGDVITDAVVNEQIKLLIVFAESSPVASTSKISKIKLTPKRLEEVVPVPKSRRVFPEHEGKYKITMPAGTTAKTQKILKAKATGMFLSELW